jgi:hypothetical protein
MSSVVAHPRCPENPRARFSHGVIRMSRRQTTISVLDHFDRADRFEWVRFRRDPMLLERARFLSEEDRKLVEMSLRYSLTRRQMGVALGFTAGTITRKLRHLVARLRDPLVIAIIDPACTLPPEHRQIGIEYFLHQASIPSLAVKHDTPRNEIREMVEYIRGWHRGVSPAQSPIVKTLGAIEREVAGTES